MVYAILPDHSGKLWLSTNNGISRFDPHSETFRNYNMDNGLQSNEFNTGAYLKCEDGNLLFGGINGFNIIDPVEVRHNKQIPAIVITNFIKFEKYIKNILGFKRIGCIVATGDMQAIPIWTQAITRSE